MPVQVTAIMLGVEDVARSKKFYGEGLGCTIDQDHPGFVSFDLGDGSSSLALYPREGAANDAGVSPEGRGSAASRSTTSCRPARPSTRPWPTPRPPAARS
jgi:catechol 2,3-dioxygenase-like lactoylglutathione lyase family enzyme